jgi:hypothetical protein
MKSMSIADLSQPKLPPQNVEAEQSVLGAVLLDNSAMAKAMELLVEENFYRTSHRKIYRAMLELSDVGEVIDQITLTERLKAQGEIEVVGGAAYLAELVQSVASSANIRYHCKIVRDKALLRELIHTSTEVLTRGYEGTSSVDDLLDFAERSVFSIVQGKLDRSFTPINSIIKESLDLVDKLSKRKEHITGVPTGFYDLDDITAGLQPSDLVVIAGRPSMGKTSLALGVAAHAAIHAGTVVGIFSLEMSHGVYPCVGEDRWIAIAVFDEAQWHALVSVAGAPAWANDARFADQATRFANQDALDAHIAAWTRGQDRYELMHKLQSAGVAACAVQTAEDAIEHDPQIASRGTFFEMDHPVIGPALFEGMPIHFSRELQDHWRSAPLLGEDNAHVFKTLLGVPEDEYEALAAEGVF